MKSVEVSAPTIEEAIRLAQIRLDAYNNEIDVEVIEKGSKGFLGLFGVKEARVTVKPKPVYYERKVRDYLKEILDAFDKEVYYDVNYEGKTFRINIQGDEISRLIGKHGKTISALQHIMNIYANRLSNIKVNVFVDVGNYKDNRKESIEDIAHKMARIALKKKKRIVMEPMFAFERRKVHEIVSEYSHLRSYSKGLEPYRKVIVEYVSKNVKSRNRKE
ncbi:MAG: RNA-binding cell elongation regulator Jag/EloR [Thermotogota bacterium]|nr:RNA-binding cell elongation regulator Jag/EloR [Thermotogota bacterium]